MTATPASLPKPTVKPTALGSVLSQLITAKPDLAQELDIEASNLHSLQISGVTNDSNQVKPGDVFFALPGMRTHGASYANDAAQRGAVMIVTDATGQKQIAAKTQMHAPVLVTNDPRDLLGDFAAIVYGEPAKKLKIVGITGTNGKTTTAWFLAAIAQAAGLKSASLGTTGVHVGESTYGLARTTPEACELQAALAYLVEQDVKVVAMEVSSHALALGRTNGTHFQCVGFTGLSQDHLDFHEDMGSYFTAKAKLFDHKFSSRGRVVADEWGSKLLDSTDIDCQSIVVSPSTGDWQLISVEHISSGLEYAFRSPQGQEIQSTLAVWGEHNALNAVLAVALTDWLDIDAQARADVLASVRVPGRMQIITDVSEVTAIVDYAHTPDAISRSISAARAARPNATVSVVFGAGGNRDRSKRAAMAWAALEADQAIVTDDNPRDEAPEAIRKTLRDAMVSRSGPEVLNRVSEVSDRRLAIRTAIAGASPGDVVLVLGKGHELGQEIAGVITPFDDSIEVAEAFLAKNSGALSGAAR